MFKPAFHLIGLQYVFCHKTESFKGDKACDTFASFPVLIHCYQVAPSEDTRRHDYSTNPFEANTHQTNVVNFIYIH